MKKRTHVFLVTVSLTCLVTFLLFSNYAQAISIQLPGTWYDQDKLNMGVSLYVNDSDSDGQHDPGEQVSTTHVAGWISRSDLSCWMASAANMLRYNGLPNQYSSWAFDDGITGQFDNPWSGTDTGTWTFDEGGLQNYAIESEGLSFNRIHASSPTGSWSQNPADWTVGRIQENKAVGIGIWSGGDMGHALTVYGINTDSNTITYADSDRGTSPTYHTETYSWDGNDWDLATGTYAGTNIGYAVAAAETPYKLEWIQTYDSPDNGDDRGRGVALDSEGNIYVAGCEYRSDLGQRENIWLMKYDTDGNTLWPEPVTYDKNSGWDEAFSVAVDAADNVYVTGYENGWNTGSTHDIWLNKYDPNGNPLWPEPVTYDSPAHNIDQGYGVTVDAAGNVYVTGTELRHGFDILLMKYDPNGNPLWDEPVTYDNPNGDYAFGYDVVTDAAGNVYVTGYVGHYDNNIWIRDIWLQKYDMDGNTIWTETYDSPAHDNDIGSGVAVDAAGNVYVTGTSADDIWLRKYDTDGNTLWTETYDSPTNGYDQGFSVAVDATGNVYVSGTLAGDIWLRKYDTDGNTLWTETYDSLAHAEDFGYGVTVDTAGNIYVTGQSDGDIILLKYSQPGYVVIPEPGTLLLLAPALLGFAGVLLKRRK